MKKLFLLFTLLMITLILCSCHTHNWIDANCTSPLTCADCGMEEGDTRGHLWMDATCTAPKTCSSCGITEGTLIPHTWQAATCTTRKTCIVCGTTEGLLEKHSWQDATCTAPKTCTACGKQEGTATDHSWKNATCTSPKTCFSCGKQEGAEASHRWKNATCTSPKTCTTCGKQEGTVISHSWKNATCTSPKICSACSKTEGSARGHTWETVNVYTKKCKTCGVKEIDQSKLPVKLGNLQPSAGENYHKEFYREDIYGNEFLEGLFFNFGATKTKNAEYVLNRQYKNFTTTIMVSSGTDDYFGGRIKIYVDEILAYDSNTINKKTQPINIEIDISNAMFIRFEVAGSTINYKHGYILLANPTLHH